MSNSRYGHVGVHQEGKKEQQNTRNKWEDEEERDRREKRGARLLSFLSKGKKRNITTGTNTPLKEKTFPSWTEQKNKTFQIILFP